MVFIKVRAFIILLGLVFHSGLAHANQKTFTIAVAKDTAFLQTIKPYLINTYLALNYDVEFVESSLGRGFKYADEGKVDALTLRVRELETESTNLIRIPVPLVSGEFVLYCQQSIKCNHTVFNDPAKIIGVVSGTNLTSVFMKDKHASTYQVSAFPKLIQLLKGKRLNYILSFEVGGKSVFGDLSEIRLSKVLIKKINAYHYVHQKHKPLAEQIEQNLLNAIKQLGPVVEKVTELENDKLSRN